MSSDTFEQVLTAAQADGSFTPAWKKFVRTKFFVPVIHPDKNAPASFKLRMSDIMGDGKQSILISEVRERVQAHHGGGLASLYGADLIRMLHAEASILVALNDRAFNIAADKVEWLKKGIEASQARAAAQKAGAGAAPAAPVAAPVAPAAPAVALAKTAPAPAPARRAGGVLDVAALKPRNVTMPRIGLDFFVPAEWRQSEAATGLRFDDDAAGAVVEASGFHRADLPLAQWVGMRLDLVRHEMRYLKQDGESYALDGDGWRDRVKGTATEFTGTFPGDEVESRFLVACIWVDGTVAAITIKARADSFERDRAVYKWLLSRIDITPAAAQVYRPPSRGGYAANDDGDVARPFGLSFEGRIGRVRALAYSVPMMLPSLAFAVLAAVFGGKGGIMMVVLIVLSALAMLWFSLRLMVLRLHDINLSGKWIFAGPVVIGMAAVTQKPLPLIVASVLFWIASLVIYCFIPGSPDENDYGPRPGPNTTLVNIGAAVFVLLQLVSIGLMFKSNPLQRTRAPVATVAQDGAPQRAPGLVAWTAPDGAMSIDFPAPPAEVELPKIVRDSMGGVQMRQFKAKGPGGLYMVQLMDYGKNAAASRGSLEGLGMHVVGTDGVQVSEDRSLVFNGHEGREVRAATSEGKLRSARFVIVGPRVFMALAVTNDTEQSRQAVDSFLESFALAPAQTN